MVKRNPLGQWCFASIVGWEIWEIGRKVRSIHGEMLHVLDQPSKEGDPKVGTHLDGTPHESAHLCPCFRHQSVENASITHNIGDDDSIHRLNRVCWAILHSVDVHRKIRHLGAFGLDGIR